MKQTIFTFLALLSLATSAQAQEDSLRYRKNDGSIIAFPPIAGRLCHRD